MNKKNREAAWQEMAVHLRPAGKQRRAPQLLREEPFRPPGRQIRHEQLHE